MLPFTATIPNDFAYAGIIGRKTHFQIFETMADAADYAESNRTLYHDNELISRNTVDYGRLNLSQAIDAFRNGDMSSVSRSDALLADMECVELESPRRAWRDDVAGAVPNVQAFIAGHPLAMRRRVRTLDAAAPIAIVVDIGANAAVKTDQIERRGAAILALVRTLAARRPVELWAGSILAADGGINASATFFRIETTPLDLARAAFVLTNPAALRRVVWAAAMTHMFNGRPPYNAFFEHRHHMRAIIEPAFPHVSEILCVTRNHDKDAPAKAWLAQQLALHCPELAG